MRICIWQAGGDEDRVVVGLKFLKCPADALRFAKLGAVYCTPKGTKPAIPFKALVSLELRKLKVRRNIVCAMKAVFKNLLEGMVDALVFNLGPRVILSDVNDQQFVDILRFDNTGSAAENQY